ncbi:MAG TPA: poly-gamma-glutamate system protein [bacterium]|jgi:poly-gamma-glutamate system protein|nr:poly-gamma-glutamate system protein [bacterium]MDX9804516.1 poly-gamma-glutamate system protein [bacterium]HNW16484.1 poly-gamma-glutamate system protein [bacterium]HNZ53924.1 poly-gamma-glutamate system protein [bacterium]HPG35400.1 poly-gamma-glutamate system protein [bacterium]
MKKVYWKPVKTSWQIHVIIAIVSLICIASVELFKIKIKKSNYQEKVKAAQLMDSSIKVLKKYRLEKIGPIDPEVDPVDSGIIGTLITPITSNSGVREAKLATVNPNWAAVMIEIFNKADIQKGDTIAAGFSGSFPALNIAVLSAAEVMKLKVVAISSAAASTWGANIPDMSWLDMERILNENKLISNRSVAASLGGSQDRATGMSKEGKELLRKIIERNGAELIFAKDEQTNLDTRMTIYNEKSGDAPIKAFVNVGGGTISVGTRIGKQLFKPGLNKNPDYEALQIDSVMTRFAKEDVPVIHMTKIRALSGKYGLPYTFSIIPRPGEGALFSSYVYDKVIVSATLFIIVALLIVFIKMGYGGRLFSVDNSKKEKGTSEPMV